MLNKRSLFSFILVLLPLLIFISCENELTSFGDGLLPEDDGLPLKTDTIRAVGLRTVLSPPIATSGYASSMLGEVEDSFFGITKSVFFSQILPFHFNRTLYKFPEEMEIKEVNLILGIESISGDDHSILNFTINELIPSITYQDTALDREIKGIDYLTDSLFSNTDYLEYYSENELASISLIPSYSLNYDEDYKYQYIKLTLPVSYGQKLATIQNEVLEDTSYIDTNLFTYYKYNELINAFHNELGAISIKAERNNSNEKGALLRVSTKKYHVELSEYVHNSRIEIIYSLRDTLYTYNYMFDPRYIEEMTSTTTFHWINANYYQLIHDYNGFPIDTILNSNNFNQNTGYIQSLAGLNTLIEFPNLNEYYSEHPNLLVAKARLEIKKANTDIFLNNNDTLLTRRIKGCEFNNYRTDTSYLFMNPDFTSGLYNENKGVYTIYMPVETNSIIKRELSNINDLSKVFIYPVYASPVQTTFSSFGSYYRLEPNHINLDYTALDLNSVKLIITYATP